jgi:hypothetical protein
MAVTAAGIAADDPLVALHHAWLHSRGLVRIVLTDCGPSAGPSPGSAVCDATTWMGLMNGVHAVLAHDMLENPSRRNRSWGMLFLRVPDCARSVVVEAGPGDRLVVWPSYGGPSLTSRDRMRIRRLARRAQEWLGRPMSIEVMATSRGDWMIVDLRFLDLVTRVGSLP